MKKSQLLIKIALRFVIAVVFLVIIYVPAFTQNWDKVQIKVEPIAKNIYCLYSKAGGNMVAWVGEKGIMLIDSDLPQLSQKIKKTLEGLFKHPSGTLINTHWHFDHTGGNEFFAKNGFRILAHENVKKRMSKDQKIGILNIDIKASPKAALPIKTFSDKMTIKMKNEEVLIQHLPKAHTDGDCFVYFKNSNVLHTGDLVFNYNYPFIDISSGGDINGIIKGLDLMLKFCNDKTVIVPGHGPLLKKQRLQEYRGMMVEFRDGIQKEIVAGKSLEQTQKSIALKKITDKWGYRHFPPPMFIKMIYLSLSK